MTAFIAYFYLIMLKSLHLNFPYLGMVCQKSTKKYCNVLSVNEVNCYQETIKIYTGVVEALIGFAVLRQIEIKYNIVHTLKVLFWTLVMTNF